MVEFMSIEVSLFLSISLNQLVSLFFVQYPAQYICKKARMKIKNNDAPKVAHGLSLLSHASKHEVVHTIELQIEIQNRWPACHCGPCLYVVFKVRERERPIHSQCLPRKLIIAPSRRHQPSMHFFRRIKRAAATAIYTET